MELKLTPEQQAKVEAAAEERGIEASEFLSRWIDETLPSKEGKRYVTAAEKIQALDALAAKHNDLPAFPPEIFNRENIYADEDEQA